MQPKWETVGVFKILPGKPTKRRPKFKFKYFFKIKRSLRSPEDKIRTGIKETCT